MKRCIIIAAGDCTEERIERKEGDFVIACDAGFAHCKRLGIEPDLILGDFDSLAEGGEAGKKLLHEIGALERTDASRVKRLAVRKDDTDSFAAARIGLEKGYRAFVLYGMLGGRRLSHTLANLQTLLFLKRQGAVAEIRDAGTRVLMIENEKIRFASPQAGTLSLLPADGAVCGITLTGLSYEAENLTLTQDHPLGVSNAFVPGQEAVISVKDGVLFLIIEEKYEKP